MAAIAAGGPDQKEVSVSSDEVVQEKCSTFLKYRSSVGRDGLSIRVKSRVVATLVDK